MAIMGVKETVPDHHIIPDRRASGRKGRRYRADRRQAIRWEPGREPRRRNRRDRRKSLRCPWDDPPGA